MNQGVTNWLLSMPHYTPTDTGEIAANMSEIENWANQFPFLIFFAAGAPLVGATSTARGAGITQRDTRRATRIAP